METAQVHFRAPQGHQNEHPHDFVCVKHGTLPNQRWSSGPSLLLGTRSDLMKIYYKVCEHRSKKHVSQQKIQRLDDFCTFKLANLWRTFCLSGRRYISDSAEEIFS